MFICLSTPHKGHTQKIRSKLHPVGLRRPFVKEFRFDFLHAPFLKCAKTNNLCIVFADTLTGVDPVSPIFCYLGDVIQHFLHTKIKSVFFVIRLLFPTWMQSTKFCRCLDFLSCWPLIQQTRVKQVVLNLHFNGSTMSPILYQGQINIYLKFN